MNEELERLKSYRLNISCECEDVIEELEAEKEMSGNIEIDVFYRLMDVDKEARLPVETYVKDYPIFIDYQTKEEIEEDGIDEDLKRLSMVTMTINEAIEVFTFQNSIIKEF